MGDIIRVKRGNEADLPSLVQGEFGLTLDTEKLYVGLPSGNVLVNPDPASLNDLEVLRKIYGGVTTVSNIAVTTDATFDYTVGKWVFFKADVNISAPATISIDGGLSLTAKDSSGVAVDITANKVYLCSLDNNGTDFFQLASGNGGGGAIQYGTPVYNKEIVASATNERVNVTGAGLLKSITPNQPTGTWNFYFEIDGIRYPSDPTKVYSLRLNRDVILDIPYSASLKVYSNTDDILCCYTNDGALRGSSLASTWGGGLTSVLNVNGAGRINCFLPNGFCNFLIDGEIFFNALPITDGYGMNTLQGGLYVDFEFSTNFQIYSEDADQAVQYQLFT